MGSTKVCAKCNQELPSSDFFKNSHSKDGLHSYCKACLKSYKKSDANSGGGKSTPANGELSRFTPREIINHLRALGYKGTLTYEQKIIL